MTKKEFMMQYVLNRALANDGRLNGDSAAEEALKAWKVIEREAGTLR